MPEYNEQTFRAHTDAIFKLLSSIIMYFQASPELKKTNAFIATARDMVKTFGPKIFATLSKPEYLVMMEQVLATTNLPDAISKILEMNTEILKAIDKEKSIFNSGITFDEELKTCITLFKANEKLITQKHFDSVKAQSLKFYNYLGGAKTF